MRKLFFLLFTIQCCIGAAGQIPVAGQLKVTIESFQCHIKSWDGFVEFDGHGNEVFLNYGYRIYDPATPTNARVGSGTTPIFGSNINGQTNAGTASAIGGITNGDFVPVNMVIINERINANDVVLVSPSVWEWDIANNGHLGAFNTQLATDLTWISNQPYVFAGEVIDFNNAFNGRFIRLTKRYKGYFPITKYNFLVSLVNVQENRPVGMHAGTFREEKLALYDPAVLFLDTRALFMFYDRNKSAREGTGNHPIHPGVVDITLTENTYAVTTSNGSYTVKLKIEFQPDAPPVPVKAPIPPKYTKDPVTIQRFPTQAPNTIAVNVTGKWTGTYGYGESSGNNYFSLQLNAGGTLQLIDQNGAKLADGTYTNTNGVISGSYSYSNNTEFSFSGTQSGKTISGTWGNGKNISGEGRFVLNKN